MIFRSRKTQVGALCAGVLLGKVTCNAVVLTVNYIKQTVTQPAPLLPQEV